MESADLRIFQMVAREGSITKAALRLGYVQSNVTARVQQLESELGTALFIRHNRGMTLSASGKTLLAYADQIVGLLEEAGRAISSSERPSGPLAIGSTQTAAAVQLPKLLAAYYEQHPHVHLSLTTGRKPSLIEKVLRYDVDGAFISGECDHPELQTVFAFSEELAIVSAPSVNELDEAVNKPILVLNTSCSYRDILEQWLKSRGLTAPKMMEFGTLEAVIGCVSAGLGISLMSRAVIRKQEAAGAVRAHALPESFNRMTTRFVTRKNAFVSSALRAFIEMLKNVEDRSGEAAATAASAPVWAEE